VSKFPRFPEGIATPFPSAAPPPRDDDATLTPEQFVHRPQVAQKGRGALTNLRGRYDSVRRESFDDGWQAIETGVVHDGINSHTEHELRKALCN
jgi:hypothetical protein